MRTLALIFFYVAYLSCAYADGATQLPPLKAVALNCEPLLPPKQPSVEIQARAKAEVDALLKRFPLSGAELTGSYKSEDFLHNIPNADKVIEKQLRAYLICEAMQQQPQQSVEMIRLFLGQVLPTYGVDSQAHKVIASKPLPVNGKIELSPEKPAIFDQGAYIFEITDYEQAASATSTDNASTAFQKSSAPNVTLKITYVPFGDEEPQEYSHTFILHGEAVRYHIGSRSFSLQFVDYYSGSNTPVFSVRKL